MTQTEGTYDVVEDPTYICYMSSIRIRENICIFFNGESYNNITTTTTTTTDKHTMTQYNSENDMFMDMFIAQLKSAGDF